MTNPTVAIAILATRLKRSPEIYIHNSVDFLEDPGVNGRIILRVIFSTLEGRHKLDYSGAEYREVRATYSKYEK
jgi:hypothetical protein